ncbi:MAG: hypothetical protein HY553_14070 [Elusimicrobia bacterium]|nr:hypothetical protein [Elusimicrobiota bacterium]
MTLGIDLYYSPDHEGMRIYQVGGGARREDAVAMAVDSWLQGVLPPVRALVAPGGGAPPEADATLATIDRESSAQTGWGVFFGPVQSIGPRAPELLKAVTGESLIRYWMQPFMNFCAAGGAGDRPLVWMKLFLARTEQGELFGECKICNQDWPEAMASLSKLAWPPLPGALNFRQFVLLARGS